jgi:uncharacterized protein (TIGR02996 family)
MARPELMALLADVKENPDDLTPWLVLTDWLEEHGDEADRARAEYCRLCFDKLGKKTYASDWERGERRRELSLEWRVAWLGAIASWAPAPGSPLSLKWHLRRGLVSVWANVVGLLELSERGVELERWEWVEELELAGVGRSEAKPLAGCPLLLGPSTVRVGLGWVNRGTAGFSAAMAKSPHLRRAKELHVTGYLDREEDPRYVENLFRPLRERFGPALKLTIQGCEDD